MSEWCHMHTSDIKQRPLDFTYKSFLHMYLQQLDRFRTCIHIPHPTCTHTWHACMHRTFTEDKGRFAYPFFFVYFCVIMEYCYMVTCLGVCATAKKLSGSPEWHSHYKHSQQNQLMFIHLFLVCSGRSCLSSVWLDLTLYWPWQESAKEEGVGWRMMHVHIYDGCNTRQPTVMPVRAKNPWSSSWSPCLHGASSRWRRWWWLHVVGNRKCTYKFSYSLFSSDCSPVADPLCPLLPCR